MPNASHIILAMLISVGSFATAAPAAPNQASAVSVYHTISDATLSFRNVQWGPFLQEQFTKFFEIFPNGTIEAGGSGLYFNPNVPGEPSLIGVFIPRRVTRDIINPAIKNARAAATASTRARRSATAEAAEIDRASKGSLDSAIESDLGDDAVPGAER